MRPLLSQEYATSARGPLRPREGVGLLPAPAPPSKRKVGEMMVKNLNHLGVALAAAAAGVLAAVGMLMLMLVVVEPAGAAFPGQNGKIAFVSNSEIFTVNADG